MSQMSAFRASLIPFPVANSLTCNNVIAAAITVNCASDQLPLGEACTLRDAITSINSRALVTGCSMTGSFGSNDTVTVGSLPGNSINLSQREIVISRPLALVGPG